MKPKHLSPVLLLLLFSCGLIDSRPGKVEKSLRTRIDSESKGVIKLTSFKKTDGMEQGFPGYPLYQMQFEAIIEYQQDCYKSPNSGFGGWLYGDFLTEQAPAGGWDAYLGGQSVKMPKGLKVKLQGTATFTKMESGWNLGKVEIKHSENITNP